jgi:hypothetical protein
MERYPAQLNIPQSQALVCVDTRDGLKSNDQGFRVDIFPNNPYDINIYKNQQIFSGAVSRIFLKEISMPWNIPNVNERNNIFSVENTAGLEKILVVDVGFYLPTELALALTNLLNTTEGGIFGGTSWVVAYNEILNSFVVSSGSAGPLFRVMPLLKAGQLPQGKSSTLAEMMGLNGTGESYQRYVLGSYASMLYTAYVDVQSDIICKNQRVRDTSTNYKTGNNILARIYICPDRRYSTSDTNIIGTRPFHLWEEFNSPKVIQWNTDEFLPSANIKLLDDKGDLLYALPTSSIINVVEAQPNDYTGPAMNCGNSAWVNLTLAVSESI